MAACAPGPPPSHTEYKQLRNRVNDIVYSHLIQIPNRDNDAQLIRKLCQQLDARIHRDGAHYISFTKCNIQPVLQKGQKCGLVALSMASQVLCSSQIQTEDLFEAAVKFGYTKQGEIFSAENLSYLAESMLHCNTRVVKGSITQRKLELVKHLAEGHIVIIPYDRDGNNEPCCKQGQKAHWAVLYGMVLHTGDEHKDLQMKHTTTDEQIPEIHYVKEFTTDVNLSFMECQDCKIYVLAIQGKSRKPQLWSIESLLDSNGQLKIIDPNIAANGKHYVIKELDSNLNARFFLLS